VVRDNKRCEAPRLAGAAPMIRFWSGSNVSPDLRLSLFERCYMLSPTVDECQATA